MSASLDSTSVALIARDFALDESEMTWTVDDVRRLLAHRIAELLDQQPVFLMSLLYRIDVREPKVKHALQHSPPDRLALDLAELVIARQLEKAALRATYRVDRG
ncbi:MAG: hypothetical protein RhofKO_00270 [Rhodothermales bacterium]